MAPTAPAIDVHPRAPGNLVCTLTSRLSGTAQRVTVVETRAPSVPLADRSWRYSKITPPMSCGTQAASQKTGPVRFPIEPGGAFHWREGVGVAQKLVSAEVPRRVLYRVEEAVVLLGLSRSQLYELIRSGRLQTVTEGRVRLIPAAAIDAYVSLLTIEAKADSGGDAA